jgi:hypothetical protein
MGPPISSVHDRLDRLHVIYNKDGEVHYAVRENNSWSFQKLPGYGSGCGPHSMAVDSKAYPHILKCGFTGGVDLYHIYWNGSVWVPEPIEENYFPTYASIFIDPNDQLHVVYMDLDNWVLRYAWKEGGSWKEEVVGSGEESFTSLVVDSEGNPHATYYEGRPKAVYDSYAFKVGSRWVSEEFSFPCIWSSLAINSTDGIHLVYRHDSQLGYAYRNESGWQPLVVDSRDINAHNPSIALDTRSIPHIAYYDYTHKNLVYATKSQPEVLATVDINPDTLNLRSRGRFMTAYIELEDVDVRDIDASSIRLNDIVPPVLDERYGFVTSEDSYIVDHDENGLPERMVKFFRSEIQEILDVGLSVPITVTGQLFDGTPFSGTDEIGVIDPKGLTKPKVADMSNLAALRNLPETHQSKSFTLLVHLSHGTDTFSERELEHTILASPVTEPPSSAILKTQVRLPFWNRT